jgi:hypothetical protein
MNIVPDCHHEVAVGDRGICFSSLKPDMRPLNIRLEFPLTYAQLFSAIHTNYTVPRALCLRPAHRSNSVNRNEAQAIRIRFRGNAR